MAFDQERVVEIIEYGVSDFIKECREYSKELNMNVTGLGVDEYLDDFNDHESPHQKQLREKLVKSNKSCFSFLLRPIDKVFTAKGGSINYNLQTSQIQTIEDGLMDISQGLNLKTYLKKVVKTNYVIDPNSFVMIDLDEEGRVESKVYRSEDVIHYEKRGNQVTGIVFEYFENEDPEDKNKYYRVIDENTDAIYIQNGSNISIQEGSEIENFFGYVPAYVLGDTLCPNSDKYLSVIDDVVEDAKEHLRDLSVSIVHKLSHGYAKYWQYPENCTTCGGDGHIETKDPEGNIVEQTCPTCHGTGTKNRKDASDLMLLDIPQEGDPVITTPGGYLNPSIEIWQQYKEDIKDIKLDMFQSLWGATYKTEGQNETATGRLLNVQPEAERVKGISETFAKIHEFILNAFGQLTLNRPDYEASVSYGTRYLMESPDEVLNRYILSKEKGVPAVVQQDLLDRFYQTEYQNNNEEYIKTSKILAVDPFPSYTPEQVKALGIEGEQLLLKIYYPQWVNQLGDAKKQLMTIEELKNDLMAFISKININIEDEPEEIQETGTESAQ